MKLKETFSPGQSFRSRIMRDTWNEGKNATIKYRAMVAERIQPGMRILHAGCGWDKNNITRPYQETCHVVGIDLDPRVGPRYHSEFALGSILEIPFADNSFDIVLSEYVIEHIEEPKIAFRELARTLKPEGRMLILTPNLLSYKSLVAYLTPYKFHIWMGRIRYGRGHEADMYPTVYKCNTASQLFSTVSANGFQKTTVQFVTNGPTWFETFPLLFEIFHVFHLAIAKWEVAQQLRCTLILEAQKQIPS